MTCNSASTVGAFPSTAAYRRCIHQVFLDQASATPGCVAIRCGERLWTYAAIAAASRAFAAELQEIGVGPGSVVGIGIGRSMEFVVAALAVLRCGAAYAPLPCDDPVERLALLVDSAGMTAIVTASADGVSTPLLRARPGLVHASISADTPPPLAVESDDHPACDPESPAAVMFTSGSTGTPKGVVVPHRAIVGLVTGQTYADFGPGLCTVMAAPTAFDASTFEIWGPLLHGGTVVVYPDRHFDLVRFGEVVRAGRVTCLWLTAALFNHVIDHAPEILAPVRHVLTGGDVVSVAHVRRAFEVLPGIRLTNGYGPTETTTFACTHDIDPADIFPHGSIPLGRPLAHTDLLVVSEEGHPVPDGVPGELWIGGSGVAKGYLSGSEATFVADPRPDGGVGTMYRSGDLCRRLPDGTLLFLGRIDQQVKIRGHRVEPGEVESTLLTHPSVRAAAVLPFTRGGETALAALVVRRDGSLQPIEGLREWIEERLPAAFVPARLLSIVGLPINPNGKLDRKALLALLEAHEPSGRGAPPHPGTESRVASLWRGVLRGPAPGRDDDFFAFGGHSLMAMRLVAAIEREFHVRLPVTAVFETRTLSRLAAAIDAASADGAGCAVVDDPSAQPPIPASDERLLPALPAQRGMWLLDALLPDRATYNQPFAFRAVGPVDWEGLRGALGRAMARHGALRSCLVDGGDGPVQRILPNSSVEVPWAEEPLVEAERIEEALFDHGRRPFDLGTAPLWRATLFSRAAPHGILLLTFHHAIIDDWSIDLLLRELAGADRAGDDTDAAVGVLTPLSAADEARCTRYWKETLAGASGELPWPRRLRPLDPLNEALGGLHRFSIDGDSSAPLRGVAGETGATEFQILLAAFHAWLRRVTGSGDVVVGTPVSLRRTAAEQASIGCFLNTLPVRVRWDDEAATAPSFFDHVRRVGETFLDAVGHGALPFDAIVSAVVDRRTDERSPIVTTLFVATLEGTPSFSRDGVTLAPITVDTATAKFDLTLFLERHGDGWRGAFEFDRRRFDDATIAGFATTFPVFLKAVLASPAEPVERMSMLSAEARRVMLALGDSADPATAGGGLIEGFLAQVEATPEAVAVRWAGGVLRYRELHEQSERIAARLRSVGVSIDAPVAICLPRSPELQAAILGVLMAGAACVPIDPTLPSERLAAMVGIARCPWVVCDRRSAGIVAAFRDLIPGGGDSPRPLRIDADDPDGKVVEAPAIGGDRGERLAYVLFTSGSTGIPKGVQMPVGPLANLVAWQCRNSVVGPGARTLQFASCGFDVSFQEVFSTWLSGGELVIVPEATRLDPVALLALVMDSAVERIFLPVAVLEHLAEAALATARFPRTLREVIVAGEQLRIGPAIRRFFAKMPAAILWNQYGPTESHVVTSEIFAGDPEDWPDLPAIGRPVTGVSIKLLDGSMEPVPVDVAGEIWIGGACLAHGYVGRDDLTAERFVDDPFTTEPGRRMYRSGDIGRWRSDGLLEYLGRVDRQVKIRGHRVEPDEVEAVLAGHPLVAEAAVVARRDDRGELFLVAHVVPAAGAGILPSELVGWLAARLPAAMVPERLAVVGELPLTHNGKLDRGVLERMMLPSPVGETDEDLGQLPLGGAEQAIAELWLAVLGRGVPRRHDDFFRTGGTSLSAMRLVSRARGRLGIDATVRDIFDHPTLGGLAAHWLGGNPTGRGPTPIEPLAVTAVDSQNAIQPASAAQRGMWFLQSLLPEQATYNQPYAFRPEGPIEWRRLQESLRLAMIRHPTLRAALEAGDDGPVQRIAPIGEVLPPWLEDSSVDATSLAAALRAHARHRFDLAAPPLWRATLFPAAAPHGVLLLTFHHGIIDDWSIDVLLGDVARIYERLAAPDVPVDVTPAVVRAEPTSVDPIADRTFWTTELAECPDGIRWSGESAGQPAPTGRGETLRFRLDASVVSAWRRVAEEADATLFQALLAACHAWLHRTTGMPDTVVATPVAGRDAVGAEEAVGCFLNTLPTRVRWDREMASPRHTMSALVRGVRERFLAALDHARFPFDEIVTCVSGGQAGRRLPVTNVMFVFLEPTTRSWSLGRTKMAKVDVDTGTSRFDLTLSLVAGDDGIEGTAEYSTDVLDAARVARLVDAFRMLVMAVAAAPHVDLGGLDLLAAGERQLVLHDWNDTAIDLGLPATLQELFSVQVCRSPDSPALLCGKESLSYAELAGRVNRLARFLRTRGVGPDVPVGVCMERSVEMVVALLGIVTAGGAYLPLDPDYPQARIAAMLASAAPPVVLVQDRVADRVADVAGEVFRLDAQWHELGSFDDGPLDDVASPDNLAYVIYTSGSTGAPKGVMNTHAGIVNRLRWIQKAHAIGGDDRVLQKTPFGFDVSVWEFFWPLLTGASLVLAPPGTHRDPAALATLVGVAGITVIHFVPSMLEVFLDVPGLERSCRTIRHLFCSGEALAERTARRCLELMGARLHNLYGPTEAAVEATFHECRRNDPPGPVPIGRPIANMRTYVLDAAMRPVGVGIEGELWLAGVGVARGYLGRPDLTAERFLPDPFFERPGERMYRTGDRARWRPDGTIEYLGRIDHQVKIRGVRIELGEIGAELARIGGIARSVVIDRELVPGDRRLVAYVVAAADAPDEAALKAMLAERLPEAMVPWRVVRVDTLPVNANGKLDRSALPLPDATVEEGAEPLRAKPVGETEEALASIWCALLGVPAVGRDDGFFARGGHSLLSMRLVAAIERRFGVRLPVRAVFETPRLADLAARIDAPQTALPESMVALTTVPAGDDVVVCRPLPAQRGMWLLHALLPDPATYNVPIAWRVAGPIEWPRLVRALGVVTDRHPALRTALVEIDGELVQRVQPPASVVVPWREARVAGEGALADALREEAAVPFDLAVAPLLRAVRFDVTGGDPVVMLTFHHAIVDEWSIGILREDLATAYAVDGPLGAESLPVVTSTRDSGDPDRQREFWRTELAGAPPETPLPGRPGVAEVESTPGSTRRFTVDADVVERLRRVAGGAGVTFFSLLLASAHAWLRRISGERDLVIGTPVATRGAAETSGAVGCLINVLPVRVTCEAEASADVETLPQFSSRVQEKFLRAVDHADLPFHEIVAAAVAARQGRRQPLVNVLLTVVETGRPSWEIGPASFRPVPVDAATSRFEVSLTLEVGPDGIVGTLESPVGRFEDEVIAGFVARYVGMLDEVAAAPAVPIARMRMLPTAQRRRVIEGFNETAVDLGPATTLHRLVADTVSRTPTAIAVREGAKAITYADLDRRAGRLARRLRALGIGPGQRVGVALPRSTDAIVSMLAVLRAGAAWVPLDREASPARAAFIASDAGLAAIVCSVDSSAGWPSGIAVVDPADAGPVGCPEEVLADVDPGAPAYVMYTSGSTGQPKGVVIPHSAVVNYLRGKQRRFPLESNDVVLHATRTTFDISVYEVFGPLLGGASLVILPAGRTDPARVAELVHEARVTVVQVVPSLLALLVEDRTFTTAPTVRRVFCGGEAMTAGLMRRFHDASTAELVNVYGPTEATVWATAWVCERLPRDEAPPIGRPLDNVRCYVLDAAARPVPVGAVGELFIGGDQLAIGYHDRPDLTTERFLPDPFADTPGARIYRTGDACRWRPDGVLEFVARTDQQVKIRGHRIEPAEIEACLATHPEITAAAVAAVPMAGDAPTTLMAAIVPRGGAVDAEAVRRWAAERLPEVMVPSRFVTLDALPVNANGKVDRQALAGHFRASSIAAAAGPCDAARAPSSGSVVEAQIRAAWQRVFGRVDFGDEDNFFHHLGGQSILAARLAADLSALLGRRVPLAAVFEAPTVKAMTALLSHDGWKPRFRSVVPLQPFGDGPPMWLFHGVGGGVSETLALARALQPDVPVYALQAVDRDGGVLQESLAAMAEHYADEIIAFQPHGPCFLGGFSLGGWFAYETARQLRSRGRGVALLAQFDTHINCILPDEVMEPADRVIAKEYVWKHLRRLARHPASWWRILGKLPARIRLARQWRGADPIRNDRHGAIVANYRAMPYDGPVDYFRSVESLPSVLGVWKRLCPGGVTVHSIPGEHHGIIQGTSADTVAGLVRGIIRERTGKAAAPGDSPQRSGS